VSHEGGGSHYFCGMGGKEKELPLLLKPPKKKKKQKKKTKERETLYRRKKEGRILCGVISLQPSKGRKGGKISISYINKKKKDGTCSLSLAKSKGGREKELASC